MWLVHVLNLDLLLYGLYSCINSLKGKYILIIGELDTKLYFRRGTETEQKNLEAFGRQWLVCVHVCTCACSQERKHPWEMGLNLREVGKHRHFAGPEFGSTVC